MDDGAFGQCLQQLGALFAHRGLDHGAARQHDVVALAVELDDLELHGLALVRAHVLDRARVEQAAGQEGADAVDQHGQATLDLAVDRAGNELAGLQRVLQRHPRGQALGLVARQDGVAVAVLDGVDGHRDEVADLDFDLALVVLEFLDGDVGLALQAGVDDHVAVFDAHDLGGDDLADAHVAALQRLFEQGGEGFHAGRSGGLGLHVDDSWGSARMPTGLVVGPCITPVGPDGHGGEGRCALWPGDRSLCFSRRACVVATSPARHRPILRCSVPSCRATTHPRLLSRVRRCGTCPWHRAPRGQREGRRCLA